MKHFRSVKKGKGVSGDFANSEGLSDQLESGVDHNITFTMADPDVQVVPASKKSRPEIPRPEPEKPPTDGTLTVTVYVITKNHTNTAITKSKRFMSFDVEEAAHSITGFDRDDHQKNTRMACIHAGQIHSLVIGHFGRLAREVIDRVAGGNEPRLLTSCQNTNSPNYSVRLSTEL
jgi:hypothetical protein